MPIAPVQMLESRNGAASLGRQGGHNQRGPTPQIGGLYRRAVERRHAAHHGYPALHADIGSHPGQFVHMAVPALKNILYKEGGPLPLAEGRHQRAGRRLENRDRARYGWGGSQEGAVADSGRPYPAG